MTQNVLPLAKIPKPDTNYQSWEIESILEILLEKAVETGEIHSQMFFEHKGQYAPQAHRATTMYRAIEIIRQLQYEVARLTDELADADAEKKPSKRRSKKAGNPKVED
jgi:hypothetical protein